VASQYYTNTSNSKIPHVIVVSADGNELIGSVSGLEARKSSGFTKLKAAADAYLEDGTLMKQPGVFKWFSTADGYSYTWPLYDVTEDSVVISKGKKPQRRAFNKIQPGGVKFAKRYVKAMEEKKFGAALSTLRESFSYPEQEAWVSTNGKAIEAQFISLEGDQVNLKVDKIGYAKKNYTFSLDKLNEESQAKAKKWQEVLSEQKAKEESLKKKN